MNERGPRPPVMESPPEKEALFSKKDITSADLKAARTELHEKERDGDWVGAIRQLSYMKQAGVVIKSEKRNEWQDKLVSQLDTFLSEAQTNSDPRKLVLYFSHLKYNGFLEEGTLTDADRSLMNTYYKERSADGKDKNFSRFCASLRYLDVRKSLGAAQPVLNAELQRVREESSPDKKVLTAVRFGYAARGKGGLREYLNDEGRYEKAQLLADVNQNETVNRSAFARSVALYQFATGETYSLTENDKKSLRNSIPVSRRLGPGAFFGYIGHLATLWRQGRKTERDVPVDVVDNEVNETNVLTDEDSRPEESETTIAAGKTDIQPRTEGSDLTPPRQRDSSERRVAESAVEEGSANEEVVQFKEADPFMALDGENLWERVLPDETRARINHAIRAASLNITSGRQSDDNILAPLVDPLVEQELKVMQKALREKSLRECWSQVNRQSDSKRVEASVKVLKILAGALRVFHLPSGSSERKLKETERKEVDFADAMMIAADALDRDQEPEKLYRSDVDKAPTLPDVGVGETSREAQEYLEEARLAENEKRVRQTVEHRQQEEEMWKKVRAFVLRKQPRSEAERKWLIEKEGGEISDLLLVKGMTNRVIDMLGRLRRGDRVEDLLRATQDRQLSSQERESELKSLLFISLVMHDEIRDSGKGDEDESWLKRQADNLERETRRLLEERKER